MPKIAHIVRHQELANCGPWSVVIFVGIPKADHCLINAFATLAPVNRVRNSGIATNQPECLSTHNTTQSKVFPSALTGGMKKIIYGHMGHCDWGYGCKYYGPEFISGAVTSLTSVTLGGHLPHKILCCVNVSPFKISAHYFP